MSFHFRELLSGVEAALVGELGLSPRPLAGGLAHLAGTWKGAPVTLVTRAYAGGAVGYARFAELTGAGVEIVNALVLPRAAVPLPILGADLVALGRDTAMIAADLSPTLPPGAERDASLAPLSRAHAAFPALPPGGALPAFCAAYFSPYALYTRFPTAAREATASALRAMVAAFLTIARATPPRPDLAPAVAKVMDDYAGAHRTDDRGLDMLEKMFGRAIAARYLAEVLFPSPSPVAAS